MTAPEFDTHCLGCKRLPADHHDGVGCLAAGHYGETYDPRGLRPWAAVQS